MVVVKWCLLMAIAVGGIGFLAGFFGPLIFQPESNQGPLLGILITGPLGFVAGAVFGIIVGLVKAARGRNAPPERDA